ncbi:peptidoglycan DD-metalloendopeptidase family protein [Dietzia cercidiphylli]|uniref:peptidoglycan DD-metalloendopeptidase family protein n=1 Tax=Dietzia cercidiphylli TaxID=498199 RepID=UPI003F7EB137
MTVKWWWVAGIGAVGTFVAVPVAIVMFVALTITAVWGQGDCAPTSGGSSSSDSPSADGDLGGGQAGDLAPTSKRVWPLAEGSYQVSGEWGPRVNPVHGSTEVHGGIDLAAPMGTPMFAAMDGRVVAAGEAQGFGNWVVIDHNDDDKLVSTVYGHIQSASDLRVKTGEEVTAGQEIALVGSGGTSTGAHLHFEYVPGGRLQGNQGVDPRPFLGNAERIAGSGHGRSGAGPPGSEVVDGDTRLVAHQSSGSSGVGNCGFGGPGGNLKPGAIPEEFVRWYQMASQVCEEFTAPLGAAQTKQEGNFQKHGANHAGASGYTQFIPGTWAVWGRKVDDSGKPVGPPGSGDPNSIGDAVMAQAHYMCAIFANQRPLIDSGKIKGDPVDLALAGYNAGEGAVIQYGGIPPYAETTNYVARIRQYMQEMTEPGGQGMFQPNPGSPLGEQIVQVAQSYLGQPYVWGGGDINGPTSGVPHPQNPGGAGLDCSGLTTVAVYKASGGTLTPPRLAESQQTWDKTVPVALNEVQAGDLLFEPGHVAIATGNHSLIEAPTFGQSVSEGPIRSGMTARRVVA